jgi:hypothetical protein
MKTAMVAAKHRRIRRLQHGAVSIEGLVVVLAITVMFAAATFIGSAYRAKLETFAQATSIAFQYAGKGCGPRLGGSYRISDLLAKPKPDPINPDPAFLGGKVLAQRGEAFLAIENSALLGPKKAWNFSSEARLVCNEVPMNQDEAWDALGAKDWAVQGVVTASGFN